MQNKKIFCKKIIYFIPIPVLFLAVLSYIQSATLDVPTLNDYIKMITCFVGEGKFKQYVLSPAVFTSAPIALFFTWVNIKYLKVSVYFYLLLGVVGLALIAVILYKYALKHNLNIYFYAVVLLCIFSLNKWEMILNGTGWVHFWAFAAFYLYYFYIDKWYVDLEQNRMNYIILVLLPVITILGIAVFYAAVFTFIISIMFGIIIIKKRHQEDSIHTEIIFLMSVAIPLLIYLVFSLIQKDTRIVSDGSFFENVIANPLFFIQMFTASFSSEIIGVETVLKYANGIEIAYVLGMIVMLFYGISIYCNIKYKIYYQSYIPLILIMSGICNHIIILFSRWGFHVVSYGMSSRYELQYLEGLLGIILTAAFTVKDLHVKSRTLSKSGLYFMTLILIGGSIITTFDEVQKAPYRLEFSKYMKNVIYTYDCYSDDELKEMFVLQDGNQCREALDLLKKYRLSVWKDVGNDLESSYKVYGVYEDGWLEKESQIVTYSGKIDKITLGFYLPDNSLDNAEGDQKMEVTINGEKYVCVPQEGRFDLEFDDIQDAAADIKIKTSFSIQDAGEDTREKSMVLYSIQCE